MPVELTPPVTRDRLVLSTWHIAPYAGLENRSIASKQPLNKAACLYALYLEVRGRSRALISYISEEPLMFLS